MEWGAVELALFNLGFSNPVDHLEGRVTNLGESVMARSGVWTFEGWDAYGIEVSAADLGLHTSTHLNLPFSYVEAAAKNGFIELPTLNSRRPLTRLKVNYVPLFTKTPLQPGQIGALIYFLGAPSGANAQSSAVHFAWPSAREDSQL